MNPRARALLGAGALALFYLCRPVAAETVFEAPTAFDTWREHYYEHPSPESAPMMLVFYAQSEFYHHVPSRAPVGQFYAALFRNDRIVMRSALRFVDLYGSMEAKLFYLNALWLANTEESTLQLVRAARKWDSPEVRALVGELSEAPPKNILMLNLDTPSQVRELWELYFATGDAEPLERIIELLADVHSGNALRKKIATAALLSLQHYARTHPRVFEGCVEAMVGADPATLRLLESVVMDIEDLG